MRIVFAALSILALSVPQVGTASTPSADLRVGEASVPGWWVTLESGRRLSQLTYHRAPTEAQVSSTREAVVDDLAEELLLALEAQRRGIRPESERVTQEEAALIETLGGQDRAKAILKAVGGTAAGVKERARRRAAGEALISHLEAAAGPITEEMARAHYEQDPGRYVLAGSIRAQAVLVKVDPSRIQEPDQRPKTEARAREIVAALREGAEFRELAARYPRDAFQDLGWVHLGALQAPMDAAAENLPAGEVTDPLPATVGFYVLQAVDRRPGGPLDFETVQGSIEASLRKARRDRLKSEQSVLARQRWPVEVPDQG